MDDRDGAAYTMLADTDPPPELDGAVVELTTQDSTGGAPMPAVVLEAFQDWYCPNCTVTDRTRPLPPGSSRYHTCAGLHMLTAPLVRAEVRAKVTAAVRDDYLSGDEQARGDDGKPYMNVRTTYDDHDDLLVNAGLATAEMRT